MLEIDSRKPGAPEGQSVQHEVLSFGIDAILSPAKSSCLSSHNTSTSSDSSEASYPSEQLDPSQRISYGERRKSKQGPQCGGQQNGYFVGKNGKFLRAFKEHKRLCRSEDDVEDFHDRKGSPKKYLENVRDNIDHCGSIEDEKDKNYTKANSYVADDNALLLHTTRSKSVLLEKTDKINGRMSSPPFTTAQQKQYIQNIQRSTPAESIASNIIKDNIFLHAEVQNVLNHCTSETDKKHQSHSPDFKTQSSSINISSKPSGLNSLVARRNSLVVETQNRLSRPVSEMDYQEDVGRAPTRDSFLPMPNPSRPQPEALNHRLHRPIPLIYPPHAATTAGLTLGSHPSSPTVFSVQDPNSAYLGWPLLKTLYPVTSYGTPISPVPGPASSYLTGTPSAASIYNLQLPLAPHIHYFEGLTPLKAPDDAASINVPDTRTRSFTVMDTSESQDYIPRVVTYVARDPHGVNSWPTLKTTPSHHQWQDVNADTLPGNV